MGATSSDQQHRVPLQEPRRNAPAFSELDISVVVPVFNSHATLEELVERTVRAIGDIAETYEIILVDGSSDNTAEVALELRPDIVVVEDLVVADEGQGRPPGA